MTRSEDIPQMTAIRGALLGHFSPKDRGVATQRANGLPEGGIDLARRADRLAYPIGTVYLVLKSKLARAACRASTGGPVCGYCHACGAKLDPFFVGSCRVCGSSDWDDD